MGKRKDFSLCLNSLSDTEEGADDAEGFSSVTVAFPRTRSILIMELLLLKLLSADIIIAWYTFTDK